MNNVVIRKDFKLLSAWPHVFSMLVRFMTTVLILLILATSSNANQRPDIILIMADDMGYSDLGSFGSEIQTPNLDKLADNGLRFSQFYNSGRCAPTRASILTGLYQHQAGVGRMVGQGDEPGYLGRLSNRAVTIPEVLKDAGYISMISGKWHVTHYDYDDQYKIIHPPSLPLERGFDRFFGTLAGAGSFYTPKSLMRGTEFIEPGEDFYYTDAINDEAVKFIEEVNADQPLFLYLSHVAPHWPLHALPEDIKKYKGVYDVGWDEIREQRYRKLVEDGLIKDGWQMAPRDESVPAWEDAEHKEWEAYRKAVYAAQVDRMDQGIGRVVEALKRTGRLENTLILFLSDNGGASSVINGTETRHGYFPRGGTTPEIFPGEPDTYAAYGVPWANVSNTPFRLYKQWSHEGGIASPFIVHWPDGIREKGAVRHQTTHIIDIMATIVEIADAKYPQSYKNHVILPMEGISMIPAFNNEELKRDALFWEHYGHRAVRTGKWKLVAENNKDWELYDMEEGRAEMNNLIEVHPEKAKELIQMWDEWANRAFVR